MDLSSTLPGVVATAAAVPGQDKVILLTGTGAPIAFYTSAAYSSVDGGLTWKPLGTGTDSAPLTLAPTGIVFDPKDVTGNTFWIYGFYTGASGGVYSTTDGGKTFTVHAAGPNPYDSSGVSVAPDGPTVLVGQYGATQSVWRSNDGGANWEDIGPSLPAGYANSEYPYIINSQTYLVGCSFAIESTSDTGSSATGATPAILRTADGGGSWTPVLKGYRVFGSPTLIGNVLYWSYFNGTDGGIVASADQGQTWSIVTPDSLTWSVAPVDIGGGQGYASLSTANQVVVYKPGETWPSIPQTTVLGPVLPLTNSLEGGLVLGLTFDSVRNSFFGWATSGSMQRLDLNTVKAK